MILFARIFPGVIMFFISLATPKIGLQIPDRVEKVVVTSSCVTFGPSLPGQSLTEDSSNFHPFLTAYERSRYQMEHVVTAYVNQGLSVIVVNPTRVFGPGLLTEGNSVTKMIQLYLRGK